MPINPAVFDLDDLTPAYLKEKYLKGLVLLDENGEELDDTVYQDYIDRAAASISQETSVTIVQTDIVAERHDYRREDYIQYAFLKLFQFPAQSVSELRALYPTGQTIQAFPPEWVRLDKQGAQIQLVPTSGSLSQVILGQGADFLPLVFSALGYVPQLWEVDYRAGFPPDQVPRYIVDAICKKAVVELLMMISDTVTPIGLSSGSLSLDGMSQSKSYLSPAFANRMDRYTKDLYGEPSINNDGMIKQIERSYKPINLVSA